ncbi:SEC14d domain-containing protein [Cryptosporidium ubiquitum]|uniref:SEC14d domain-containing protein n=1 Tax=Cryptosporidium ubiquitum TaxID=857276 RepID=A0A1J4MEF9_9CRYT|nr:SEC14d domain-containing protein [Cryptosporidium ubiquitum]OII72601.1 SEC14d domain-containing protein [Cryptosporidium ubiquitum]
MESATKKPNRIELALDDWAKLVKKSCSIEIEQIKKKHTKITNQYKPERTIYMENVLSYQHTKNICLLASEIIRRNGVSYLIIDFLKQMLFLRGFFALTKDTTLMQLTRFSTYMKLVEDGMNAIYESSNTQNKSALNRIKENRRRILIYNIKKVLDSGIGFKHNKQPVYYIRIVDLHLKTTLSFGSISELRQLLVWELEKVIYSFSDISLKEKSFISHITFVLDFSNMGIYTCKVEFQSFMRLISEVLDFYSPLLVNTLIIHKSKSLKENLWYSIEPIISLLYDRKIVTIFTDTEDELWRLLEPTNMAILHSRGGFIPNTCLYPVCTNSTVVPNIELCIQKENEHELQSYNKYATYKNFFLSFKPELSIRRFINNCTSIEKKIINKSYWIEEQNQTKIEEISKSFNEDN